MRHTLEEEANQRGRRSSGHRPVLKHYCVRFHLIKDGSDVNQRWEEKKSYLVGKVVQLELVPLALSTRSRREDHMIWRRNQIGIGIARF